MHKGDTEYREAMLPDCVSCKNYNEERISCFQGFPQQIGCKGIYYEPFEDKPICPNFETCYKEMKRRVMAELQVYMPECLFFGELVEKKEMTEKIKTTGPR